MFNNWKGPKLYILCVSDHFQMVQLYAIKDPNYYSELLRTICTLYFEILKRLSDSEIDSHEIQSKGAVCGV